MLFRSCRTNPDGIAFDAGFTPVPAARAASSHSLDAWLLERYCLYAADEHGSLFRTVVQHPPWQYSEPAVTMTANSLGEPFGLDLSRSPDVTHFSSGLQAHVWPFALQDPDCQQTAHSRSGPARRFFYGAQRR